MTVDIQILRNATYFKTLPVAAITDIASSVTERSLERGEAVFLEDDPCEGIYLVVTGRVRVYKVSPEGREQVLLMAGPGETFNEAPVFDGGPNPATAETTEPCVLYLLPKERALDFISQYPDFARGVLAVFALRLRHLTVLVEDLSFRHVRSRVAKILLQWTDEQARGKGPERITQRELAAMAGSAREVVARAVKNLEESGALGIDRGRIVALSPEKLLESI